MNDLVHRLVSGYHVAVRLLRHEVIDATPAQWRLAVDTLARLYFPPKDLKVRPFDWYGLPTEAISREGCDTGAPPIVWIHGGGFAFCSPRTHRAAAGTIAAMTGREVWLPDYPLAPEHPYPEALDTLCQIPIDSPLDIIGDSAGGNLALAWALRRKNRDRLALLSPWLDLRVNGASSVVNVSEHSAFDREDLREYASLYLKGFSPTDPDCSPLLAPHSAMANLGSIYIESAADELLHADAQMLAQRLQECGARPVTHIEPKAHHGWQLLPDLLPEAKQSAIRVSRFFTQG